MLLNPRDAAERRLNETVYRAHTSDHPVSASSEHNVSRIILPPGPVPDSPSPPFSTTRGRPPLTFRRYKFVSLHHPLRIPFLQWVNCTLTLRAASDVSRGCDRYPSEERSIDPGFSVARLLLFLDRSHTRFCRKGGNSEVQIMRPRVCSYAHSFPSMQSHSLG